VLMMFSVYALTCWWSYAGWRCHKRIQLQVWIKHAPIGLLLTI